MDNEPTSYNNGLYGLKFVSNFLGFKQKSLLMNVHALINIKVVKPLIS